MRECNQDAYRRGEKDEFAAQQISASHHAGALPARKRLFFFYFNNAACPSSVPQAFIASHLTSLLSAMTMSCLEMLKAIQEEVRLCRDPVPLGKPVY